MKKTLVFFGGLFIIGLFLIVFYPLFTPLSNSLKQEKSDNSSSSLNSPADNKRNLVYIVKEYNGNIAIFEENSDVPFKVTDIRLCELPEGDKKLLSKGIPASSSQELNCILEDYCS